MTPNETYVVYRTLYCFMTRWFGSVPTGDGARVSRRMCITLTFPGFPICLQYPENGQHMPRHNVTPRFYSVSANDCRVQSLLTKCAVTLVSWRSSCQSTPEVNKTALIALKKFNAFNVLN